MAICIKKFDKPKLNLNKFDIIIMLFPMNRWDLNYLMNSNINISNNNNLKEKNLNGLM